MPLKQKLCNSLADYEASESALPIRLTVNHVGLITSHKSSINTKYVVIKCAQNAPKSVFSHQGAYNALPNP